MTDSGGPATQEWPLEPETRLLREVQTAMDEAALALSRRMRLSHTDLSAMAHLTFAPSWLGPRELSDRLGITPAAATELVDRLERAGHVERRRDPRDRRRVNLVPTPPALTEVADRLRPLTSALDTVAEDCTEDERRVIVRYLTQALEAYRTFSRDG